MDERLDATFETKCWERDWRKIVHPGYIEGLLERHLCRFSERVLLVNNVEEPVVVMAAAEALVKKGLATEAVYVPDYADLTLASFALAPADLGAGYWYSIAEIVGIRLCRTRFLVHFAGDAALGHYSDWVEADCLTLEKRSDVSCVNPVWNGALGEARRSSVSEDDRYWYGRGFSDQCYLIEADRWRNADLKSEHPASERYPAYGGALFERRADSWMRCRGLLRATDKTACYLHPV